VIWNPPVSFWGGPQTPDLDADVDLDLDEVERERALRRLLHSVGGLAATGSAATSTGAATASLGVFGALGGGFGRRERLRRGRTEAVAEGDGDEVRAAHGEEHDREEDGERCRCGSDAGVAEDDVEDGKSAGEEGRSNQVLFDALGSHEEMLLRASGCGSKCCVGLRGNRGSRRRASR